MPLNIQIYMLQNSTLKLGALHSWLRPYSEPLALGKVLPSEGALNSAEKKELGA